MRYLVVGLTCTALFSCASCSGNHGNLFPVSGMVMVDGKPAPGATVFLRRVETDTVNDQTIMGIVQEDGSFELVCGSLGKGAPPGEYNFAIEWKQISGQRKGRPERGPDRLKGRYSNPKTSGLHATIEAGRNDLEPFELTN